MRLRELREARGLSQSEVARRMGRSQPYVHEIEAREILKMQVSTVRRYVEALGGELRITVTLGTGEIVELV